jgi:hypothetical protein
MSGREVGRRNAAVDGIWRDARSLEERAILKALAVPVTAVPPAGLHPDEALLSACAAYDAAERQYLSFFHGPEFIVDDDEREVAMEPTNAERDRLVKLVCGCRATTLEGYLARIRVVMLEDLELDPAEDARSQYFNESLLGALLRDLAEHAGVRRPA